MGLKESIEEDRKELEKALKAEAAEAGNPEPEEVKDEPEEPEKIKESEETEGDKDEQEPEKVQEKAKEEEPDASGYRKLRRDRAAAEKLAKSAKEEADDLRRQIEELKKPKEEIEVTEAPQLPSELADIVQTHRMTQAEREFHSLEAGFRAKTKDYDAVADHYAKALFQSLRIQNPRMNADDIAAMTKKTILVKAGTYMSQGYDPIEELYEEARSLGFTGLPKEEAKEEEEVKQPDLTKVAANRQRNAGTAGAKGRGGAGVVTPEMAANDYSTAEWMALPAAERKRIMKGG